MAAQDISPLAALLAAVPAVLLAATGAQAQPFRPDRDGTPAALLAEPEPVRFFRCESRERGSGIEITLDPARGTALVRRDRDPGPPETFRLAASAGSFRLDRTTREGAGVRLLLDRLSLRLTSPPGPRPEGPPVTCSRVVHH